MIEHLGFEPDDIYIQYHTLPKRTFLSIRFIERPVSFSLMLPICHSAQSRAKSLIARPIWRPNPVKWTRYQYCRSRTIKARGNKSHLVSTRAHPRPRTRDWSRLGPIGQEEGSYSPFVVLFDHCETCIGGFIGHERNDRLGGTGSRESHPFNIFTTVVSRCQRVSWSVIIIKAEVCPIVFGKAYKSCPGWLERKTRDLAIRMIRAVLVRHLGCVSRAICVLYDNAPNMMRISTEWERYAEKA